MSQPWQLGVGELLAAQRQHRLSAETILEALLTRIDQHRRLGCFVRVDVERARRRARELDAGPISGPLHGVPVALKDNLAVRGWPLGCGSRMLEGHEAGYDAAVVERLRAAGALLLGQTNMDEFGMGSSCENSAHGPVRNPWHAERVAGGSSGGSAAAVAAGLVPLALGSDTGGSVRQPAAFCGVLGLRPSYGTVSRRGLVAFASSLDQVGPLARSVADLRRVFEVIRGADPGDPSCRVQRPSPPEGGWPHGLGGLRVGLVRESAQLGMEPAVQAAVERAASALERCGALLVDLSLPHCQHALACYAVVSMAEASSNLARYDGVRYGRRRAADTLERQYRVTRDGFGDEVKRRLVVGSFVLSHGHRDAYYETACRVRAAIAREYATAFERVHLLLGPTAPTTAFELGSRLDDPLAMYHCDVHTVGPALAGLPALSLPAGRDPEGLPLGLQLCAPAGADDFLLEAAGWIESELAGEVEHAA